MENNNSFMDSGDSQPSESHRSHQEEINGIIDRIIFTSQENGFSVFVLQLKNSTTITAKGHLASINPGEQVTLTGSWVTHPKFGKQFDARSCVTTAPTSIEGLKKYLGSGLIKGIGPTYAEKLVTFFGTQVLEVIDKSPHLLGQVPGIGPKRVEKIASAWQDQKEVANIMVFLQEKQISATYATKIYKKYGQESIALITQNPYRLADDIWGIGFKMADAIAQNMGIDKDSIKRIRAGILFVIQQEISNGHLYAELESIRAKTIELLELERETIEQTIKTAFHDLHNDDKIKLITYQEKHFITLSQYYNAEMGIAHKIERLLKQPMLKTVNHDAVYQAVRAPQFEHDIMLNEEQQTAVMSCFQHKITIITGGPGTGKTTIIKKLLTILEKNNLKYVLAAPTGRAAKRISESTARHAQTIHRLLEFDVSTFRFTKNETNAIAADFIIIDEASMIDVFLAYAIVKATPFNAHLIFIGDIHQLPSVGAGNFLHDLIASQKVTCITLEKIFRQAQDSLIIVNAHRINKGEFPVSHVPQAKKDYLFIKEDDAQQTLHHLQTIFSTTLPRAGIAPHDALVLVPMNRGVAGTQTINHLLQQLLNPDNNTKVVKNMGTTFKIGDRVMQIRNNYDKLVFNGDMGYIEDINPEDHALAIRFGAQLIEYEHAELDELTLAYAISIHKSQGSEFPAVIIPLFMQHFMLLQRNLVYTAVTRAKKLCIVIGQTKALAIAIKNNKGIERITFLKQFLMTDLKCR